MRRYTELNIRANDIRDGVPLDRSVADLTFFDPPYGSLLDDTYTDGSISGDSPDDYTDTLIDALTDATRYTKSGGYVALLISTQFDEAADGTVTYTDYPARILRRVPSPLTEVQRVQVPMARGSAYAVRRVKKMPQRLIERTRDLIIWRVE